MDHVLSHDELEEYREFVPEIPWLGYDHKPSTVVGAFDDYALQRGWSEHELTDLKEGRLEGLPQHSLKAFLQSWFSIGLWEAALGKSLAKDAFIVSTHNKRRFTSEPLKRIISDLETQFKGASKEDRTNTETLERFKRVLQAASLWNRMLSEPRLFVSPNADFCDQRYHHSVMRLFTLLGVTLQYTVQHLARWVSGNHQDQLQYQWFLTHELQESRRRRMAQRGWCPYIISMLSPLNQMVAEYAAIVGPPSTYFDHRSCSAAGCSRHNVDETTYRPLHIQADCQCPFVRPSLDQIAEILDKGQIPVMDCSQISKSEAGQDIQVVAYEANKSPFTAVSHVWSGGFGSVAEKGLPQCTIDRLCQYIEANGGSKLVWIDSLSIPRDKRLRRLSIHSINRVFSLANATLMLDPELMRSPSSRMSTRRLLLWITTSAWMQRMWTLPEGRLSHRVYIAFNDSSGRFASFLMEGEEGRANPVTGALMLELVGLFASNVHELRYIHQSLCYRTTSKQEDEAPALAALFDIDTRPILSTMSVEERMALFWIALRDKITIPMNIIFLRGSKLSVPGLRWAPSSLLNAGRQLSLVAPPTGTTAYNVRLGSNGTLTATYVVILLDRRAKLLLGKFNPIKLSVVPEPGSSEVRTAVLTLLTYSRDGSHVGEEAGSLHDIDAFAINVTNLAARAGQALANELMASVRTAVALTLDTPDPDAKALDVDGHSFRARHLMQLSPIETLGNELISGSVGWAQISIS